MLTQDQLERERYEARVKLHRDEVSRMIAAREEGEEMGAKNELAAQIQQLERLLGLPRTTSSELQSLSLSVLRDRSSMLTKDQLERERYEARVKVHRDEISRRIAAREESEETAVKNELTALIQRLERLLQLPQTSSNELQSLSLNGLRDRSDALMQRLQPKP